MPVARGLSDLYGAERAVLVALVALTIWSMIQIVQNYPDSFFPRFADEAIYALDARVPGSVFDDYKPGLLRYAPAKLGYGIPLAVSVAWAGPNGPMYLSTLCWFATLAAVGLIAWRLLGVIPAAITVASLSYSALFGKYIADVGPTAQAALAFVLLWGAACTRRSWLIGLAIGWIAFIDFKWAVPAGVSYVLIELFLESRDPISARIRRLTIAAMVSLAALGVVILIHRPYWEFLANYALPHGEKVSFVPSPILVYYMFVFGAYAPVLVSAGAMLIPDIRRRLLAQERRSGLPAARALCVFAGPALFYSLFGELKAARFFAVPFPLLLVVASAVLAAVIRAVTERMQKGATSRTNVTLGAVLLSLAVITVVHSGSRGPAHHLTLPTGYPEVLKRIRGYGEISGSLSSYNWSVTSYAWEHQSAEGSFAYMGIQSSDKWIALDPSHDRATIGLRVGLSGAGANADSMWAHQRDVYQSISDSLFSVRSDFYASDYFLSENLPGGITVFQKWRGWSGDTNWMTVYAIDSTKLRTGWKR